MLAIGGALTATELLLPDGPAHELLFLAITLGCAVTVALGARAHGPEGVVGWYLVAAAQAMWLVGGTAVAAVGGVLPRVLQISAYLLAAAGVEVLTRARKSAGDPRSTLDGFIVTMSAVMVSWVFLIAPALRVEDPVARTLAVAQPVAALVIFAALVRFAYAPGAARATRVGVLIGLGGLLAYQSAIQGTTGPALDAASRGPGPADAWLLAMLAAAMVTTHPRMYQLSRAEARPTEAGTALQLVGLGIALVVGPAAFASQILRGGLSGLWPAPLFYLGLVGLVMTRILVMVRESNAQATSDDLTGLPNRRALHRESHMRLADQDEPLALLLLDLDRFKEVNDSLGHHTGDTLLVQVAARLRSRLRAEDLLVRLGGDEFAILLDGAGAVEAEAIALSLGVALGEPFDLGEICVHSAASIGIALFPDHGTDLSTLLRKADGGYRMHGGGDEAIGRLQLAEELHTAIAEDQLLLHYQPKLDLDTGAVRGVEALVRWQHPSRGLLLPEAFLERVEESGLMAAMTRIVLSKALDQVAAWRGAGRELTVAVNLSASSLVDVDLPNRIAGLLAERALPASVLHLEITEEFLMADRARARAILTTLRDAGVTISVDDFGTGYSSLSYLRDLPIDELKLDRSFVSLMTDDARSAALVSSTIHLAHSLGLRMVAEGVESDLAYAELTRLGCDQAQGFFMSRALPPDQLESWFEGRVPSTGGVRRQR